MLMAEEKKVFTDKVLSQMKRAQLEKPKEVSWNQWNAPKKLKHRHRLIAYMAASGITNVAIAEQVGIKPARVSTVLASQRIQNEIKRIQSEIFIQDPRKRFMEILPEAINTAELAMKEADEPKDRADIAFKFMDRALGKPKESVEVKTSSIREIYEKLDKMGAPKTIEVDQKDFKELDPLEQWMSKNLGDKE